MLREYTCTIYSNKYDIRVQTEEREDGSKRICSVKGVTCPRGKVCAEQELTDPQRNIAISVLVKGGILSLTSVRPTNPTPQDRIFDTVSEIREYTLTAPAKMGTVVIPCLMGHGTDVTMTKSVLKNR